MKRINRDSLGKVRREGKCRNCGTRRGKIEAAHTIGKAHDLKAWENELGTVVVQELPPRGVAIQDEEGNEIGHVPEHYEWTEVRYVPAASVIPLCGPFPQGCHGKHHERKLDLLPLLNEDEELMAVRQAGGIFAALKKLAPMGGTW